MVTYSRFQQEKNILFNLNCHDDNNSKMDEWKKTKTFYRVQCHLCSAQFEWLYSSRSHSLSEFFSNTQTYVVCACVCTCVCVYSNTYCLFHCGSLYDNERSIHVYAKINNMKERKKNSNQNEFRSPGTRRVQAFMRSTHKNVHQQSIPKQNKYHFRFDNINNNNNNIIITLFLPCA